MELLRYVRSIKVVLILTTILLSPIKGLADGRKDEKIDRIEELSKKRSSSELDSVIEYIENLDMSKKKEVSKAQSRDAVKRGNPNNGDNSKKTVRSASTESRNNSQSWKLLGYIGSVVLFLLLGICSYLLFVVNKLSRGRSSALDEKCSALIEELSARVNPQTKKRDVSENKNKERPSEEEGPLSATKKRDWEDLRGRNEHLESVKSRLEQENSTLKEKNSSLEKEIEKLESQLKAETASERPQETESPSSEANQDKVEAQETTVYYIEGTPSTTEGIKLHTKKPNKSFFKVTVQGTSTSATLSVVEGNLDSILDKTSGFVSIEQGYGGPVAELISEGKGTIKYTVDKPEFTLTDKIKYKKV